LGASSYPILAHLNEVGKARTQKLGEIAVITSGTITHMVNKLVKNGYVEKVQDAEDKRVFSVSITDKGRQVFNRVHQEHMKYLAFLLEEFTEDEKLQFIEHMKYFGKKIERKQGGINYENE
ncbi:MAG: MarR family transcriptional regulator, partial [Vallitaleaceae bacterium]|nr:MarR family transcriptional regulator [Vallitaleaceae bacterium]